MAREEMKAKMEIKPKMPRMQIKASRLIIAASAR
jgi:hypothetical protein